MKIETQKTTCNGEVSLDVTMTDCEGFSINEWLDLDEAKEYLKNLHKAVSQTEEFIISQQGIDKL